MHVRETFCVFTLFVVCINYLLVYGDATINYKFVFTNDRHQSTPANLSYSQCAHSLTAFLYSTFISKIIYFLSLEIFLRHHRLLVLASSAVSNFRSISEILLNGRCF